MRKWQKFVLDFYVESSLHVALSVASQAYISFKLTHEEISFSFLIFIFSSALFAYNFVKYFSIFKAEKIKNTFQKLIFLISSLSLIVSIYIFLQLVIIAKIFVFIGAINWDLKKRMEFENFCSSILLTQKNHVLFHFP